VAGAAAYLIDQWLVHLHFGMNLAFAEILRSGVYGVGVLTGIATLSFFVGCLASKRSLSRLGSCAAGFAALTSYLAVNLATQHMGYALLCMAAVSLLAPVVAGKTIRHAA
jgi:hypothetical protein